MSKEDDDFESDILMNFGDSGDSEDVETGAPLSKEQESAINRLESVGFERISDRKFDDSWIIRFQKSVPHPRRGLFSVALQSLVEVEEGVSKHRETEAYRGILKEDASYVEFLLHMPNRISPVGRIVGRMEWDYRPSTCGHHFVPGVVRTSGREYSPGFHMTAPSGDTCVELSEISQMAGFLLSDGRSARLDVADYTLKVMVSSPAEFDARLSRAQQVADSLLFELDAKFGLALNLKPQERTSVLGGRRRFGSKTPISFPSTEIPREVAALFAFASEAVDNPPFSFLSYYQVLEYYMPLTSKRDAIKRIRREIRDFSFSVGSDASVLRVLNAAERAKGINEEDALKILVRDCVREDQLLEFLKGDGFKHYFSKNGPIGGIPVINPNATNESVAVQVAKRVYALRNRIVHAKDDPKYSESPQLLPRGREANSLGPDIQLARFVALETIIDAQD
ncbi:hypothetical protein [Streptomyces sp. NPDC057686]|uniref:hypothetical protein n=1 Tax=Streptomyces sp. NPDC057686 TaxID=3346212 RepID=UPI003686EE07